MPTSKRRFKSQYWDVPPVGYEHVTPREYKAMQAAGQVPQSVVNPSSQHLQGTKYARPTPSDPMEAVRAAAAVINATLLGKSGGSLLGKQGASGTGPPAVTRQARRLYVGNIPFGCTDIELMEFFRTNMEACNFIRETGSPILACQINLDKNFAFLEFRTVEETTSAMALDGILCKGQALKIRRPHDYQPIPGSEPTPAPIGVDLSGVSSSNHHNVSHSDHHHHHHHHHHQHQQQQPIPHIPGVVSNIVADSPNKIYIGGIPTYLTDDQIKEILSSFGQLKAFNLIRDPSTLASKGYAFCEYLDSSITNQAIYNLNGFDIGDKKLIVQRASVGAKSGPLATGGGGAGNNSVPPPAVIPPVQIQVPGLPSIPQSVVPRVLTEVICLMNMIEPEELQDDQEYDDILEDIKDECRKYGRVRSIQIPRPPKSQDCYDPKSVPGLGRVFVEFDSVTEAQRALSSLNGRHFANRLVITSYFDRERYRNKEF